MTVDEKGADYDPRKHPTVLTVPASFGQAQRDDTLSAAKLAGFDVTNPGRVQLIDEPVAALIDALNHADLDSIIDPARWNTVLVFDFGGGTCDLVALKVQYDANKQVGWRYGHNQSLRTSRSAVTRSTWRSWKKLCGRRCAGNSS
jgi:molecular chaperone DnaK (HSP70)